MTGTRVVLGELNDEVVKALEEVMTDSRVEEVELP